MSENGTPPKGPNHPNDPNSPAQPEQPDQSAQSEQSGQEPSTSPVEPGPYSLPAGPTAEEPTQPGITPPETAPESPTLTAEPGAELPSFIIPPPDRGRFDKERIKAQVRVLFERAKQSQWLRKLGERIQNFEPAKTADWASRAFQRQGAGTYGKAITIALCAFFLADLVALLLGRFIPEPPVARMNRPVGAFRRAKTMEDYNVIFARNLFNSEGRIPGDEVAPGTDHDMGGAPVRTTLPFNLIGTLILKNELRSIATIEDKSAAMVYPVRATDEIPSKARILTVEPRKVVFINISNGRKEFVDMPDDGTPPPVRNARVTPGAAPRGAGIERVAGNQFNVSRSEVDNALKDLNKVLTEARAVPNFENGVANGYKLFQIVPGSIYDKLGLQNGDVIQGLNGAAINDPGKAFEMLSELKTSSHLELQVKKDGRVQNYIYDIR